MSKSDAADELASEIINEYHDEEMHVHPGALDRAKAKVADKIRAHTREAIERNTEPQYNAGKRAAFEEARERASLERADMIYAWCDAMIEELDEPENKTKP